jgi:hypothetical protein
MLNKAKQHQSLRSLDSLPLHFLCMASPLLQKNHNNKPAVVGGVRVNMNILKQFFVSILTLLAFFIVGAVSADIFNQSLLTPILSFVGMLYSLRLMVNVDDEGGLIIAIGVVMILSASLFFILSSILLDRL